jgi:monoamine oxidase
MLEGVQVLVAGGGLAGLAAADDLVRRGADVRVIEARERLGGRAWTVRDPDGVHAEAGGEFIDADHEAIRSLARSLHVPLVRVLRGGFGAAMRIGDRVTLRRSQASTWKALARLLEPAVDAYEEAGGTWDSEVASRLAQEPLSRWVGDTDASPAVRAMAEGLRGLYLADPDTLSSLVIVDQLEGAPPGQSPMYRVKGGVGRLVDALARRLGDRVEPGCALRAVAERDGHLHVSTEDTASRLHQLTTDYLVVTLPPPLVLACVFEPPLPPAQIAALTALPLGAATKVSARFERPWWRRRGRPRAFGSNLPVGAVWDGGEDQRQPILTCLGGASASATLARLAADPATLARSLAFLGRPTPPAIIGTAVSWEQEPWSRGGYAVFTTAFPPKDRRLLQAWHGRIAFAGEHTSEDWQGYMNGAVESGRRAAAEIEALRRLDTVHRA